MFSEFQPHRGLAESTADGGTYLDRQGENYVTISINLAVEVCGLFLLQGSGSSDAMLL